MKTIDSATDVLPWVRKKANDEQSTGKEKKRIITK